MENEKEKVVKKSTTKRTAKSKPEEEAINPRLTDIIEKNRILAEKQVTAKTTRKRKTTKKAESDLLEEVAKASKVEEKEVKPKTSRAASKTSKTTSKETDTKKAKASKTVSKETETEETKPRKKTTKQTETKTVKETKTTPKKAESKTARTLSEEDGTKIAKTRKTTSKTTKTSKAASKGVENKTTGTKRNSAKKIEEDNNVDIVIIDHSQEDKIEKKQTKKDLVQEKEGKKKARQLKKEMLEQKKLDEIHNNRKKVWGLSDKQKDGIRTGILKNYLTGILISLYFALTSQAFETVEFSIFSLQTKIISLAILFISIVLFETAYKRESGSITLSAIETLLVAMVTLYLTYLPVKNSLLVIYTVTRISIVFSLYYIIKGIIIYFRMKRKFKKENMKLEEVL